MEELMIIGKVKDMIFLFIRIDLEE